MVRLIRHQSTSSIPESLQLLVTKSFEQIKPSKITPSQRKPSSKTHGHNQNDSSKGQTERRVLPQELRPHKSERYAFFRPNGHDLLFDSIKPSSTVFSGIMNSNIEYTPLTVPNQEDVPKLQHKLSRVLFSPGIHYLQDPRTGVFNFNPYLQNIMPVDKFDFDAISTFITASKDEILSNLTKQHGLKYYASTSSMTGALSQLHFLLSNFRPVSLLDFSRQHPETLGRMTKGAKLPATLILRKQKGCYAIDSDKSSDREIVLSLLGHSLERFLTKTPQEYEQYEKQPNRTQKIPETNTYHYASMGDFLMRSQLDCQDSRLPGTGTFDLKTRAVAGVRHDLAHAEKNLTGYSIVKTQGRFESFERELLELARSTMLKYSLQARIGNMDGIFIAYHNIAKMFGFQYLPLSKMDEMIHSFGAPQVDYMNSMERGQELKQQQNGVELSSKMADSDFKMSMKLWGRILNEITAQLPNDSFRLIMQTEQINEFESKLKVVATKIFPEEIEELQASGEKLQQLLASVESSEHSTYVQYHINEIMKLNKRLRHEPLGFDIFVKSFMNKQSIGERHPIYKSPLDKWEVAVKFVPLSQNDAIAMYQTSLLTKMNMLQNNTVMKNDEDATTLMKVLRQLGKERQKSDLLLNEKTREVVWNDE